MALIWGEGGPVICCIGRDAINSDFGPLGVGSWLGEGGVSGQGEGFGEGCADVGGS